MPFLYKLLYYLCQRWSCVNYVLYLKNVTIISFLKRENEERKFVQSAQALYFEVFLWFDDMKQDHKKRDENELQPKQLY